MRWGIAIAAVFVGLLFAVPAAHAYVYWSAYDSGNSKVGRAGLDASGVNQELVSGIYFGQGVAADGQYVYWGESGSNPKLAQIGRANADGSAPNHAFQQGATYCGIFDLLATASELFWLKNDCGGSANSLRIDRTVKTGGQGGYTEVGTGNSSVCGFDVDAGHVYWTEGHFIARAPLPGPSLPEREWLDVGTGVAPCGVAVDAGHIYWTTLLGEPTFRGTNIGRAAIDGNPLSVQSAFITGASFTRTSGIDVAGDFIYWTNAPPVGQLTGSIGRASLDGSGVGQFFINGIFNPGSLDVDAAGPAPAPPGTGQRVSFPTPPPRMISFRSSNGSFGPGGGSTPVRLASISKKRPLPKGTVFTYKLDQDAAVTIEMQRIKAGRQVGKKCKQATKANAKKKKCDLTEHKLFRAGKTGTNQVPYTGRVQGKLLKGGKYKAVITATSTGGSSKPLAVRFTFVRP